MNPDNIDPKLLDELLKSYKNPEDLVGENGIFKKLQKALIERVLESEMTHHLGYEKNQKQAASSSSNHRNGRNSKKIHTGNGSMEIEVPRDRESTFEPLLIKKRQKRFTGFDEKIIHFYARGLSVRDIQAELKDIYGIEVSESLISDVTDGIMDEVETWRNRPLDPLYPIVFLDALMVKVKDSGQIKNKAVYLALGVNMEGQKELLGMWIQENEGAKFWLQILTELKNRGIQDIFIMSIDGLNGFEQAIEAVFPKTQIQQCVVHLIRNSMKYVSYKERKELAGDLKEIYQAATEELGQANLKSFALKWDKKYPLISQLWKKHWSRLSSRP